jgi:hypothetical protein
MNTSQKKALLSIMVMALVFQVQRLLFLLFNLDSFEGLGISDFLMAFIYGIRFDLSAIIMINALYLFALLVPINLQERVGFQKGLDVLFLIINIPAIILNSIDLEYFKFQGKRTTADLFDLFVLGDDIKNTLPQMAKDFWPVLLVSLFLSVVIQIIKLATDLNRTSVGIFRCKRILGLEATSHSQCSFNRSPRSSSNHFEYTIYHH